VRYAQSVDEPDGVELGASGLEAVQRASAPTELVLAASRPNILRLWICDLKAGI
jgi:hypothetical protein